MIKKNKKLYGSKERAKNRKRRVTAIHKHVDFQIANYLPELTKLIVNIDEGHYTNQLRLLMEKLQQKYVSLNEYRIANNYLARFINEGNKNNKWHLDVPAYLVRKTRERPFRTERWFIASRNLNKWRVKWQQSINLKTASAPIGMEEDLLSAVLISAALNGGLCIPEALTALANQLNKEQKPLLFDNKKYWMDLVFKGTSQAGNVIIDSNPQTLRRWYPDPISLAWIHHFLSIKPCSLIKPKPLTKESCWKLIKAYMVGIEKESGQRIKSFELFCKTAIGTAEGFKGVHVNEAMVEYAVGKIPCASLPHDFQEMVTKNPRFKPVSCKSLDDFNLFPDIKKKSNRSTKLVSGYEPIIAGIRKAIRPKLSTGVKNTPQKAIKALDKLLNQTLTEPLIILISWLAFFLKQGNAVSSANRYFTAIGQAWILGTIECDLYALDGADFENLYLSMLDGDTSDNNYLFKVDRFEQLHLYAHRYFDLKYMGSILSTSEKKKKKIFIRSGFITEHAFTAFCHSIELAQFNERLSKEGLIILYILALRTGLRRGELLKLRLKDVEESNERWIYVRNNKYGDSKTNSASRKIPLKLLLLPQETDRFEIYLTQKKLITRFQSDALLFSLSLTPHQPLNEDWISSIAKHFLGQITNLPLVFHHFRHTALSQLQILLENDQELISRLCPYELNKIKEIQSQLGSLDHSQNRRDIYWALAGIAGHLTPETTFAHYLHFSDRILANKLKSAEIMLSANAVREISGLTGHAITRRCNSLSLNAESLVIQDFQTPIKESLKKFSQKINVNKNPVIKPIVVGTKVQKSIVTIEICYAVLKQVEEGATLFELVSRFQVEEKLINKWIFHARNIANITTSKNKSRLFSCDKAPTIIGEPLAPSLPQSKAELIDANKAINTFRKLYKKQETIIKWCIKYYISHSNTSSSGLIFHNPKDLKRFLKLMLNVFPEKRWRLRLQLLESSSQDVQIKQWQKACQTCDLKISRKKVRRKSAYPYGKLQLYLKHPVEKQRIDAVKEKSGRTYGKYSTNTMRYIFHMIAIMRSD